MTDPRITWDAARYPVGYLLSCVSEAQVQAAVVEELQRRRWLFDVNDAGAAKLRGRVRGVAGRAGVAHLVPQMMKGTTGAGRKGASDIHGTLPGGRSFYFEVKAPEWKVLKRGGRWGEDAAPPYPHQLRPAGKPSPEQLAFLQLAGGPVFRAAAGIVWHPSDFDLIVAYTVANLP